MNCNLDIVKKYNDIYNNTIKIKPVDVEDGSFAEHNEDSNEKDPKFKIGDHVRISIYKNILLKAILQTGVKKFLLSKK